MMHGFLRIAGVATLCLPLLGCEGNSDMLPLDLGDGRLIMMTGVEVKEPAGWGASGGDKLVIKLQYPDWAEDDPSVLERLAPKICEKGLVVARVLRPDLVALERVGLEIRKGTRFLVFDWGKSWTTTLLSSGNQCAPAPT